MEGGWGKVVEGSEVQLKCSDRRCPLKSRVFKSFLKIDRDTPAVVALSMSVHQRGDQASPTALTLSSPHLWHSQLRSASGPPERRQKSAPPTPHLQTG